MNIKLTWFKLRLWFCKHILKHDPARIVYREQVGDREVTVEIEA